MTTSMDLLDLVRTAVVNANTDAGERVYRPGDWPSQTETVPQIKLRLLSERRQSLARSGPPEFTTVATVRALLEVQALASEDDTGASEAEAAVWQLKRQVEVAVVNSYPLTRKIQQIAAIRADLGFNADGARHSAVIQMDLDLEFYEGVENFAPIDLTDLDGIDVTPTNFPPVAVTVDLPQE